MKKFLSIFGKISQSLEMVNKIILIASLGVLVFSVILQVLLRVVFSVAFTPLSDIITYSFPIATFVGTALLFKQFDGHISITFLTDLFGKRTRNLFLIIADVITFIVILFILIKGSEFAINGLYQFSPALSIKLFYVYAVIPLFAFSSLVFKLENLFNSLTEAERKVRN